MMPHLAQLPATEDLLVVARRIMLWKMLDSLLHEFVLSYTLAFFVFLGMNHYNNQRH